MSNSRVKIGTMAKPECYFKEVKFRKQLLLHGKLHVFLKTETYCKKLIMLDRDNETSPAVSSEPSTLQSKFWRKSAFALKEEIHLLNDISQISEKMQPIMSTYTTMNEKAHLNYLYDKKRNPDK